MYYDEIEDVERFCRNAYSREYQSKHPREPRLEYNREYQREYYQRIRMKAIAQVASLHNKEVGCFLEDRTCKGALQVDHANGDGDEERKTVGNYLLYQRIVKGERTAEDLRILCQSHNLREARL